MDEQEPVQHAELEEQDAEELPAREAMSIVSPTGETGFVDLELGWDPPPESESEQRSS